MTDEANETPASLVLHVWQSDRIPCMRADLVELLCGAEKKLPKARSKWVSGFSLDVSAEWNRGWDCKHGLFGDEELNAYALLESSRELSGPELNGMLEVFRDSISDALRHITNRGHWPRIGLVVVAEGWSSELAFITPKLM